jgi:hypothetical protein
VTSSPAKPHDAKIGRLPVWAQQYIATLEMRVRGAEAEAKRDSFGVSATYHVKSAKVAGATRALNAVRGLLGRDA